MEDLNQKYRELQDHINNNNDQDVFDLAETCLLKKSEDLDFQACKIVALIKQGKYKKAEACFPDKQAIISNSSLTYAYAYLKYRNEQYKDCLNFIESLSDKDVGMQILEAQIYFKQKDYEKSVQTYLSLMENSIGDDDYPEILANALNTAIYGSSTLREKVIEKAQKYCDSESAPIREVLFNQMLLLFENSQLERARKYLKRYQDSINKEFPNELTMDNLTFTDLVIGNLQADYFDSQHFNLTEEQFEQKIKYYNELLNGKRIDDPNLRAILNVNVISLKNRLSKQDINFGESIKKYDEVLHHQEQLSIDQILNIKLNVISLNLSKNKLQDAGKILSELETQHQKDKLLQIKRFVLLKSLILQKNFKISELEAMLRELKNHQDKSFVTFIYLLHSEFYRLKNDQQGQLQELLQLANIDKSLLEKENFQQYIFGLIQNHPNLYQYAQPFLKQILGQSQNEQILLTASEIFLSQQLYQESANCLEQICSINKNHTLAQQKLIYVYNFFNHEKMALLLQSQPKPTLIQDSNVIMNMLNDLGFAKTKQQDNEQKVQGKKIKKQKKKVIRFPKNFDPLNPGGPPDPERWLPKYERKKFKNLKRKKGLGRNQGTDQAGSETIQQFKTEKSTANVQVSTGGKSAKNKKKR